MKIKLILITAILLILQTPVLANSIYFNNKELHLLSEITTSSKIEEYESDEHTAYHEIQWNYNVINAEEQWKNIQNPQETIIAVIDSGLYYDHPDLDKSQIYEVYDYLPEDTENQKTNDSMGHGTKTIGIITRINPLAKILPIKVVDKYGKTNIKRTVDAINEIIKFNENPENKIKIKVINLSLGSSTYSEAYEKAIEKAIDSGIIVIAAVGNYGNDENSKYNIRYPAGYKGVIGVTSVDKYLGRSDFAQVNETVFVSAPGEEILSLNDPINGTPKNELYDTKIKGTSISAPHVTALAGLIVAINPDINQEEFKQILINTSEDLGAEGYDYEYGYGLINVEKAINYEISNKFYTDNQKEMYIENENTTSFVENLAIGFALKLILKIFIK